MESAVPGSALSRLTKARATAPPAVEATLVSAPVFSPSKKTTSPYTGTPPETDSRTSKRFTWPYVLMRATVSCPM